MLFESLNILFIAFYDMQYNIADVRQKFSSLNLEYE